MITLDTCAIIWLGLRQKKLSTKAKRYINKANRGKGMIISRISLWEIAMLIQRKRLNVGGSYKEFMEVFLKAYNVKLKGINIDIADLSVGFSKKFSNDPADRIIAATSVVNKAPLITGDKILLRSKEVDAIW